MDERASENNHFQHAEVTAYFHQQCCEAADALVLNAKDSFEQKTIKSALSDAERFL